MAGISGNLRIVDKAKRGLGTQNIKDGWKLQRTVSSREHGCANLPYVTPIVHRQVNVENVKRIQARPSLSLWEREILWTVERGGGVWH
jgi:hypothetical protein